MKTYRSLLVIVAALMVALSSVAQSEVGVRKRGERGKKKTEENASTQVTERMQSFYEQKEPHDADLAWMREIYRQIDLTQPDNAALYFPEDVIDGQENLFRLMLRLVVNGEIPAYEYLDGREIFTDKYKINVRDMLDRFGIYYTEGKGWHDPRIEPFHKISLSPAAMVYHYGQEMFEGLKAYKGADGEVYLFRPDMNAKRTNASNERLVIPELPEEDFVQAVKAVVDVCKDKNIPIRIGVNGGSLDPLSQTVGNHFKMTSMCIGLQNTTNFFSSSYWNG